MCLPKRKSALYSRLIFREIFLGAKKKRDTFLIERKAVAVKLAA